MEKSARNYVFEGLELIPEPLSQFVEARLVARFKGHWQQEVKKRYKGLHIENGKINWDQSALLHTIDICWGDVFRHALGRTERSLVIELQDVRNKLAHNKVFSYDDAERALDTMRRLMDAISAGETAQKIRNIRDQILKPRSEEENRNVERPNSHHVKPRKTGPRVTMTPDMTEQIYRLAKEVHLGKRDLKDAHHILVKNVGMNEASAMMYLHGFQRMMEGECYKRAMNGYTTRYFLDKIHADFGLQALKTALLAVKLHIEFREGFGMGNSQNTRKIHQEFSERL